MSVENVGCHERGHNPTRQWKIPCQVCPKIFPSLFSFFYHMSSTHSKKLCCPWCLLIGQDFTKYKDHVLAHGGTSKSSSSKTTKGKRQRICCGLCLKSFSNGSGLWRHHEQNLCTGNSFASSVLKPAENRDDSQESIEDIEFVKPTAAAADVTSTVSSIEEAHTEQAAEHLIEKVNIEGVTHVVVHRDDGPFGCPIEALKFEAKLLQNPREHFRDVEHINDLASPKIIETCNLNFGSSLDCDIQTQVDASSSSNLSWAFACTLCEFVGDSESAALEHARQNKPSSV